MASDMKDIKDMLDRLTMEMANFTVRQNQIEDNHEKSFAEMRESLEAVKRSEKGKVVADVDLAGELYTPSGNPMAWVPPSLSGGAQNQALPEIQKRPLLA